MLRSPRIAMSESTPLPIERMKTMGCMLSLLVALLTGILGLFAAGLVAAAYADWYHIPSREGASGFFVLFMAIIGGAVATVLGLIIAQVVAGGSAPGFGKAMLHSGGTVLSIAGVAALLCYLMADFPPTLDGERLRLEVELRLPIHHEVPPAEVEGSRDFVLGSVVDHTQRAAEYGMLKVEQARREDGRWIVPAEVLLFTSRGDRVIDAHLGEESIAGFVVPLPAHPGHEFEQWSEWAPRPPAGGPAWPDSKPSYRFRVQRIPPPPPPLTAEEYEAQKEAGEQAKFDAIPADAPISTWLEYTPEWMNEKRRALAITRIIERPQFTSELGVIMLHEDPRQAEAALRFVAAIQAPDAAVREIVAVAGRDLINRIKKVNATPVEQDPSYERAADVSIRFSSWMMAARALREKIQADFIPELREVLELSRVRTDSFVMQQDIRRVSSFYMKEWAGVQPQPGDPPPK